MRCGDFNVIVSTAVTGGRGNYHENPFRTPQLRNWAHETTLAINETCRDLRQNIDPACHVAHDDATRCAMTEHDNRLSKLKFDKTGGIEDLASFVKNKDAYAALLKKFPVENQARCEHVIASGRDMYFNMDFCM